MPAGIDLLRSLKLPDRYEPLEKALGAEVASLIVAPDKLFTDKLKSFAANVQTRGEGVLVPICGPSGAGKTTLVSNLQYWAESSFAPTLKYDGTIDYDHLHAAVKEFEKSRLPTNNKRIVPINFDHRESHPPSDKDLSTIKRFLRQNDLQAPVVIFWPETSATEAAQLAKRYTDISGAPPISIPLEYTGPQTATWQNIAIDTLKVCNQIDHLEELGVNPIDYDPDEFPSVGEFLRQISNDFNANNLALWNSVAKPLQLIIGIVSETPNPGILSQLTNPSIYGLLSGHALVGVTKDSEIGIWWKARPNLLTKTIIQLNARVISIPPPTSTSCVRNISDDEEFFRQLGYERQGPFQAARDLARSDLGKLLANVEIGRFETRGQPPQKAIAAFRALADRGFMLAKDKDLNRLMSVAIQAFLERNKMQFLKVDHEKNLNFVNLIPDNSVHLPDAVVCIEYTWRKGDFLVNKNRSTVAGYILGKLQSYARKLGWTSD
jgi:hypothetical protein